MNELQPLMAEIAKLDTVERKIIERFIRRRAKAPDLQTTPATLGQRVADRVASFGGSWTFILIAVGAISSWIIINRSRASFDPFPFILLNLVLSCLAALQAPIIMMSQNRQAERDRLDAKHDYEVNLKAEVEIVALHTKLDEIREKKWAELLEIQERQLALLAELSGKR